MYPHNQVNIRLIVFLIFIKETAFQLVFLKGGSIFYSTLVHVIQTYNINTSATYS